MYRASFIILYYDQQMHNYFTNCHTPACFDVSGQHDSSINTQIAYSATTQTDFMRIVAA